MKKIGLISLALVLALGGLGVGYAMWSDTVYISGPVTTGTLNLTFGNIGYDPDNPEAYELPEVTEYYWDPVEERYLPGSDDEEYLGKNVAQTTAVYTAAEEDCRTSKDGFEVLRITVTNAYPGYFPHVTYYLHNIGSIPLDVVSYGFTGTKLSLAGEEIYTLLFIPQNSTLWYVYDDCDDSGDVTEGDLHVMDIWLSNSLPFQLEPCHSEKREIDIKFREPLEQLKAYVIEVTINAEQWAE